MKVICDRGALVEALGVAQSVVVARTPKPVLTCVKLTAGDGALRLDAVDLNDGVAINLSVSQVEVQEAGEALIPADKLTASSERATTRR